MTLYHPGKLVPPHKVTRPEQVDDLTYSMQEVGWQGEPLVGYVPPYFEDRGLIQLLSGSHRHAAAVRAGLYVPVMIRPYTQIWESWGNLEKWQEVMHV